MNIKSYTNKDGSVTYTYSLNSKKWEFTVKSSNFVFLCKVPTRAHGAERIANFIAGSFKRVGSLDNMARANIAKLATF